MDEVTIFELDPAEMTDDELYLIVVCHPYIVGDRHTYKLLSDEWNKREVAARIRGAFARKKEKKI